VRADEKRTTKGVVFAAFGVIVFAAVAFIVGYNSGQSRQLKKGSAGNLRMELHYLNLLEANNLEKLDQDLRFVIYANVNTQNRLGGVMTNGWDPGRLARVSEIYRQMSTQIVTLTPEQFMTNASGK
jgi:hypothetical protein